MTPRELAEEAADKSWGIAESGKGMMQDAVEAALLAFAKAHAEEFRGLADEAKAHESEDRDYYVGIQWAFRQAAQMLEEKLNG